MVAGSAVLLTCYEIFVMRKRPLTWNWQERWMVSETTVAILAQGTVCTCLLGDKPVFLRSSTCSGHCAGRKRTTPRI